MKIKPKFSEYNDGMLYVCSYSETSDGAYNVKRNPKNVTDLIKELKLAYEEKSKRNEDIEYAESHDMMLSLKVKTRLRPEVDRMKLILIEDTLYSIVNIDLDRSNEEMYLYLEEMRKFK